MTKFQAGDHRQNAGPPGTFRGGWQLRRTPPPLTAEKDPSSDRRSCPDGKSSEESAQRSGNLILDFHSSFPSAHTFPLTRDRLKSCQMPLEREWLACACWDCECAHRRPLINI